MKYFQLKGAGEREAAQGQGGALEVHSEAGDQRPLDLSVCCQMVLGMS